METPVGARPAGEFAILTNGTKDQSAPTTGRFVCAGVVGWALQTFAGMFGNMRANVCRPLGGLLRRRGACYSY